MSADTDEIERRGIKVVESDGLGYAISHVPRNNPLLQTIIAKAWHDGRIKLVWDGNVIRAKTILRLVRQPPE